MEIKILWSSLQSLFWCGSFHRECNCSIRFPGSTPFGSDLQARKLLFPLLRLFRNRSLLIRETNRRIRLKIYRLNRVRFRELTH